MTGILLAQETFYKDLCGKSKEATSGTPLEVSIQGLHGSYSPLGSLTADPTPKTPLDSPLEAVVVSSIDVLRVRALSF